MIVRCQVFGDILSSPPYQPSGACDGDCKGSPQSVIIFVALIVYSSNDLQKTAAAHTKNIDMQQ